MLCILYGQLKLSSINQTKCVSKYWNVIAVIDFKKRFSLGKFFLTKLYNKQVPIITVYFLTH